MQYEYFYGAQAEQFSFYRIPKALFTEPNFRELSTDAKVLYGILLDRMSLSLKNQWLDPDPHLWPQQCRTGRARAANLQYCAAADVPVQRYPI